MKIKLKDNVKQRKGITLIALVVTIIVLLILAGVSIAMLTGEGGILQNAREASDKTGRANAIEMAQLDVLETKSNNQGKITDEQFIEILNRYFTDSEEKEITELPEDWPNLSLTSKDGKYSGIKASEIYNGSFGTENPPDTKEPISKEESYVGYFVEIDGEYGIIYADLAKGNTGSGQWNGEDGQYTIPQESDVNTLKDYYVIEESYTGSKFDAKPVLAPIENQEGKKDRFYVMALNDIGNQVDNEPYYWYSAAYDYNDGQGITEYETVTSTGFGTGKTNTETMIEKWDSEAYGEQNYESCGDMWGIDELKTKSEKGWFVPSKEEWSAFAEELGINDSNYENEGLYHGYWSSSLADSTNAWYAGFFKGCMGYDILGNACCVRLSVRF